MKKNIAPSLHEIQTWMKAVLTDPRGAGVAVNDSNEWLHIITSDETSNIIRLDVYAEAYFARILETFTIDFPITAFVMGEDQFAKLIAEYLKIHPSTEYNLNNISKFIIPFINTYSNSKAIGDIVTLERRALESFYAPIDDLFNAQCLANLNESDWEKIKFGLNSSLRFIESSWPLEELWDNRHENKEITIKENTESQFYIIERISHHIKLSKISFTHFFILQKINEGAPLSSFGEEDFQNSSEDIATLFSSWIQKSYLKNFYF